MSSPEEMVRQILDIDLCEEAKKVCEITPCHDVIVHLNLNFICLPFFI